MTDSGIFSSKPQLKCFVKLAKVGNGSDRFLDFRTSKDKNKRRRCKEEL